MLVKVADDIFACSLKVSFVPSDLLPIPFRLSSILGQYAKSVAENIFEMSRNRRSAFCVSSVAASRKVEMALAVMGI